jgi:hypothetical protein
MRTGPGTPHVTVASLISAHDRGSLWGAPDDPTG